MMDEAERVQALRRMGEAIRRFYGEAVQIGNHPFIEFAGVMTAYMNSCRAAHEAGIDFTECNVHGGQELPMEQYEIAYLGEKLGCIFTGRVAAIQDRDVVGAGRVDSVGLDRCESAASAARESVAQVRTKDGSLVKVSGLQEQQVRDLSGRVGEEVALVVVPSRGRGLTPSERRGA
jgi:hypothetical protein